MRIRDCREELRGADLRATPARIAIMKFLKKTGKPVDINSAIDYLNAKKIRTDPATVFRIMNMLTEKGIATPIQFQDRKIRYELTGREHHHHLVCEACGKIENISGQFLCTLEKEIQREHKFLIKRHSLEFFGICKNCQS